MNTFKMDKYEIKAKEIENYCKKKRLKYKLIGSSLILITASIILVLLLITNQWYFFIALAIVPTTIGNFAKSRINGLNYYEKRQLDDLRRLKLEEEMKQTEYAFKN